MKKTKTNQFRHRNEIRTKEHSLKSNNLTSSTTPKLPVPEPIGGDIAIDQEQSTSYYSAYKSPVLEGYVPTGTGLVTQMLLSSLYDDEPPISTLKKEQKLVGLSNKNVQKKAYVTQTKLVFHSSKK